MRIKDALGAMQRDKSVRKTERLSTIWSEQAGPDEVWREYPRPQMRRADWINLNGWWQYGITKKKKQPEQFDGRICVPFSPESVRSGVQRMLMPGEYLWYYREVEVDTAESGKRLLLHFGAVDERCSIWWNGKLLGSHENGYLPFSFDITEHVRKGKNTLWLCVQDDSDKGHGCYGKQTLQPHGMFYTAQSGIWQTVWMEWVPDIRLDSVKITPLYDEASVMLELKLTGPAEIRISITEPGTDREAIVCRIPAERAETDVKVCISVPDFYSWTPEYPFLYELEIQAGEDLVQSYFAMRKFSSGADETGVPRLFLNNKPYFFNGILDQGYWPETLYTPPSDEAMVFDIQEMKRLGFNMMRKHIKVEPLRWYYHCDRLGMVVWQDMINGGGPIRLPLVCYLPTVLPVVTTRIKDNWYHFFARTDKKARRKWEADCMEMIALLYNCSCIGLWVPFNEGWGQFDSLRITEKIHEEDPTRLIDHASGWFDQGGGDVKSVHNYFRKLKVVKDKRPFVLSEYGGCVCPVADHLFCDKSYGYKAYQSLEAVSEAFWKQQDEIRKLEKEGMSGAVYTQVSDVEEEINGLLTYDRKVCKIIKR